MRAILISLFFLSLFACNNSGKSAAEKHVSKHSAEFNTSAEAALNSYHALTEAFVNWDSSKVNENAAFLDSTLQHVQLAEFADDVKTTASQSIDLARKDVEQILAQHDMTEQRHRLNSLTENVYDFLRAVQYDEQKVYLNECPMAFNDTESGVWLSKTDSIRNPYLGLHHPRYGKAMIDCGSNKSVIDFTKSK